jgi:F-type H+-transporting ATPase subunit epsilon
MGELVILPGHAQMVSELGVGVLALDAEEKEVLFVSGGYLDIQSDKVVILADVVERPQDIDVDRAKKAADRAQHRLDKPTGDLNLGRAMGALARATKRLDIAKFAR